MGFRVIYEFDDGSVEDVLDEVFETEEEAEEAAQEGASNYSQGGVVLCQDLEQIKMGDFSY